jgi:hypothetical protein
MVVNTLPIGYFISSYNTLNFGKIKSHFWNFRTMQNFKSRTYHENVINYMFLENFGMLAKRMKI